MPPWADSAHLLADRVHHNVDLIQCLWQGPSNPWLLSWRLCPWLSLLRHDSLRMDAASESEVAHSFQPEPYPETRKCERGVPDEIRRLCSLGLMPGSTFKVWVAFNIPFWHQNTLGLPPHSLLSFLPSVSRQTQSNCAVQSAELQGASAIVGVLGSSWPPLKGACFSDITLL